VARRSGLVKAAIALVVLAVLGVLFVRSAQNVRAEPFEVPRDRLTRWTLAVEPPSSPSGVVLALRPPRELATTLFNAVFSRTGESMSAPVPAQMALVLQSELDTRAAGATTVDALLALARESGLESATLQPKCMAHRRISAPGITRQMHFMLFDLPAFDDFRQKLSLRLRDAAGTTLDPAALSPALIVAASDAMFSRWQPLRADAEKDCFAPITVR
jgi:hypothetical protein